MSASIYQKSSHRRRSFGFFSSLVLGVFLTGCTAYPTSHPVGSHPEAATAAPEPSFLPESFARRLEQNPEAHLAPAQSTPWPEAQRIEVEARYFSARGRWCRPLRVHNPGTNQAAPYLTCQQAPGRWILVRPVTRLQP